MTLFPCPGSPENPTRNRRFPPYTGRTRPPSGLFQGPRQTPPADWQTASVPLPAASIHRSEGPPALPERCPAPQTCEKELWPCHHPPEIHAPPTHTDTRTDIWPKYRKRLRPLPPKPAPDAENSPAPVLWSHHNKYPGAPAPPHH